MSNNAKSGSPVKYRCSDWMVFKGRLLLNHETYQSIANVLGLSRERIRQFAMGSPIDLEYVRAISEHLACSQEDLAIEQYYGGKIPMAIQNWDQFGRPRPEKDILTTNELAELFGIESMRPQMIYYLRKALGMPTYQQNSGSGMQNLYLWKDIERWLEYYLL